ncbi:MAG: class D beta-lactamase [Gammaproteobacteria bacterium]
MKKILLSSIFGLILSTNAIANTKCFLASEAGKLLKEEGECKTRHAPCSTFKIAISLMGFDDGFLIDETHPELPFQEGYDDWLEIWKQPHTPTTWIKNSNIWYSQVITQHLGMPKFKNYLSRLNYGNQDASGDKGLENGLTHSWLSSSLQISPEEQTIFLNGLVNSTLSVDQKAQEKTRNILFVENFTDGWKLYGKTGSGYLLNEDGQQNKSKPMGWFVGWVEKGDRHIVFAHYIEDSERQETYSGPRAKEIAKEKLMEILREDSTRLG